MGRRRLGARTLGVGCGGCLLTAVVALYCLRQSGPVARWRDAWPSLPQPQNTSMCSNSCPTARNGMCDEGRNSTTDLPTTQSLSVLCDLGTDCDDCGYWTGHMPDTQLYSEGSTSTQADSGPVSWLSAHKETLRVRRTTTQPSFLMPITDAERDPDVSAMLHNHGHMEGGITRAVHSVLSQGCVDPRLPGGRGVVLVVGAAQGYFTLYAARMGCRVVAWEPLPLLRAYLAHGLALNNLTHLVQVRSAAVSDLPSGSTVTLGIPKHGTYWGLASVDNLNLHKHEVRGHHQAITERLDDIVPPDQPILMLKVDVEGYEPEVMGSATRLIASRQAAHVFTEYSPGIAERHRDWKRLRRLSDMLQRLLDAGYRIGHMPTFAVAAPWPPRDMREWYTSPFPALEEVGQAEVTADVQMAELKLRTEQRPDQCQVPEPLKPFDVWRACGEQLRTVHPKGFRSSHGYNTNLWASLFAQPDTGGTSKDTKGATSSSRRTGQANSSGQQVASDTEGALRLRGYAALFGRDEPVSGPNAQWTSRAHPGVGLSAVKCDGVGAGHRLLHRCPCVDKSVCGKEEEALLALTKGDGVFYKTRSWW